MKYGALPRVAYYAAALLLSSAVFANAPPRLVLPAITSSQYDPLALAKQALEDAGIPPPAGYTIREARAGELKEGELGRTDSEGKTIVVAVARVGAATEARNEGSAAFVAVLGEILYHEYGHTEFYGTPSTPPAEGYNNGTCQHILLYANCIDHLKETIQDTAAAGGERKTLCALLDGWLHVHNSNLPTYNQNCHPIRDRLFGCEECKQ